MRKTVALTIAGSDPSGGAGLQADLKTFHQFGVYGMSVVTLLTVQNTREVASVDPLDADYVEAQLRATTSDIQPQAAKAGALGTAEIAEVVASWAEKSRCPLVLDPVLVSTHGADLGAEGLRETILQRLLPQASLVTPNLDEAEALAGFEVSNVEAMEAAARLLVERGAVAALVKGGHLAGEAVDVLFANGRIDRFRAARIDTQHTHGTGCTYSAAITAELAKGADLRSSVETAKRYVARAIAAAPGLGGGRGPLDHHA